ncbi:DUF2058 domain-containing protein [Litorivicinus lipolyticus]|uniref:DUF2058 domain-containing protein n=1 Tax=Litorivicinus lipolyticus TaxID=418701 RepID=UPI0014788809|nr:DUF2058 family protein [Litorivicinus lipolyticus]
MSKSLSDQLQNLGLVDKSKAKKAAHDKRVTKKKKAKSKIPDGPSTHELTAQAMAEAQVKKAEKDRAIEAQRKAKREQAERLAQARDIVKSNGTLAKGDDRKYRFTLDKKIKEFWVSNADFERLAKGLIGVVQMDKRWMLIDPEALIRVRERAPELASFLAAPEVADPDDPYADYQIPDDLDW